MSSPERAPAPGDRVTVACGRSPCGWDAECAVCWSRTYGYGCGMYAPAALSPSRAPQGEPDR